METLTFYVRVMRLLGVGKLVLTNAAGGVNESFRVGDLMLITDHIKLCAESPARGRNRSPVRRPVFRHDLYLLAGLGGESPPRRRGAGYPAARRGVFFYGGPQFETPAEIRAVRRLGGDRGGMSTVAEAIAARQCGMEVLGLSCITNLAAGMQPETEVSDQEVTQNAAAAADTFCSLMRKIAGVFERGIGRMVV